MKILRFLCLIINARNYRLFISILTDFVTFHKIAFYSKLYDIDLLEIFTLDRTYITLCVHEFLLSLNRHCFCGHKNPHVIPTDQVPWESKTHLKDHNPPLRTTECDMASDQNCTKHWNSTVQCEKALSNHCRYLSGPVMILLILVLS